MRFLLCLAVVIGLAACSTTGTINYMPPTNPENGPRASVYSVTVEDKRDEKPNRIATIRGGYGNPLKVLDTPTPVADQVAAVFTKALEARGMLAATAPYRFAVTLNTLYGDQFVGRRAEIKIDLTVLDQAGRALYSDHVSDGSYDFTFFDNGVFASIEDLRKHVEKLLSNSIDRLLDKKALSDLLSSPPPLVAKPAT